MVDRLNRLIRDNHFTLALGTRKKTPHLYIKNAEGLYACGWWGNDYYALTEPNIDSITLTDEDGEITNESLETAYERLLLYIEVMERLSKKKI